MCAGFGLSGCASNSGDIELDPAYWFPDGKKKLPGDRREVFPGGVPGVTQGIPPELVRGNPAQQAAQEQALAPVQPETAPEAEEKPKPRPKKVARPRPAPPPEPEAQAQPRAASGGTAPAHNRLRRRRLAAARAAAGAATTATAGSRRRGHGPRRRPSGTFTR